MCCFGHVVGEEAWGFHLNPCPLTRFYNDGHTRAILSSLSQVPAIRNVQHWNIVASTLSIDFGNACLSLTIIEFSRAMRAKPLRCLEVLVIPRNMGNPWLGLPYTYSPMSSALRPLKNLRGIKELSFRDATAQEIPDSFDLTDDLTSIQSVLEPTFMLELSTLIQGNTPNESLYEMHNCLLRYAKAFERIDSFKTDMALYKGENTRQMHLPRWGGRNMENYRRGPRDWNPYKHSEPPNPVEAFLELAKHSSEFEAAIIFKENRKQILEVLEPQYQSIVVGMTNLLGFIKDEKKAGSLLDQRPPEGSNSHPYYSVYAVNGVEILKDLAVAFKRHVTPSVRTEIRQNKRKFDQLHQILERETVLQKLSSALEQDNIQHFAKWFKIVASDMDAQYLEIREARKQLFKWDVLNQRGSDIDLELTRCDEPIDWSVREPEMGPHLASRGSFWRRISRVTITVMLTKIMMEVAWMMKIMVLID